MKKVLFLIAVLAVCLSVSASAQVPSGYIPSGWYTYELSETFDGMVGNADINGQNGWAKVSTASLSPKVIDNAANSLSPDHYFQQVSGKTSAANKDARYLNSQSNWYSTGVVWAWVYDPKLPSTSTTDTRVGMYSNAGPDNIGKMWTANITSGSGLTGDYNYWRGQWSYSAFSFDGVTTPAGGAGYTFTKGPAAPRVLGWSHVMITWNYTFVDAVGQPPKPSAFHVEWYINPLLDGSDVPNMMLDCTTAAARFANTSSVQGLFLGSYNVSSVAPGRIDNVYFGGIAVPEPSSLMALGTGLIGLVGLIRRRK